MATTRLSLVAMKDGGKPKKKKGNKELTTQYNTYSGIVNEKGESKDTPTEDEAVSNMVSYMKKNTPESNVYRSKFQHTSVNYDRKKKQSNG